MRPGDRTIRDELRREAASVPIPEDMWQNISRQLDQGSARKDSRRRLIALGEQWRPAVILAVAAGFFWFALIPSLPSMETIPGNANQSAIVVPSGKTEAKTMPAKSPWREGDNGIPMKSPANPEPTTTAARHFPTLPQ